MARPKVPYGADRVIENRKARHRYTIGDTLEVGIALAGTEVKAVRDGQVSLGEGFVRVTSSPLGLWLHGVNIGEYAPAGPRGHKPVRIRKLLAHSREIVRLGKQAEEKGVTIVPLKLYFKEGWAKVLIGVGRGKSQSDKREDLKTKDANREIQRALSKRV
jgi:SsrA-binding protein